MWPGTCEVSTTADVCFEKSGLEARFPNTISPCAQMAGGLAIGASGATRGFTADPYLRSRVNVAGSRADAEKIKDGGVNFYQMYA